jgi:hypothetical protein
MWGSSFIFERISWAGLFPSIRFIKSDGRWKKLIARVRTKTSELVEKKPVLNAIKKSLNAPQLAQVIISRVYLKNTQQTIIDEPANKKVLH